MGAGIVPRLLAAGHAVTGWNRTRAKAEPLINVGMRWADSPREVASRSEIVFSIVTDATAVRAVALGPDGIIAGLPKNGIYLDMSTIAPEASRAIAAEFDKAGLTMLDAPISGSTVTLAEGKASIMVGGDKSAFERIRPVLLAIGPKVAYIGESGLAVHMKLAINLEGKMPKVPLADVNLQQKDMLLVLDLGRKLGMPVPLAAAANEMMNACRGLGIDHRDFVTAHEVYRRLGGMSG
jgi:3-hydroxyisobutyrate dehydrogenase-like beta-hydroxyacid dehydrogenase